MRNIRISQLSMWVLSLSSGPNAKRFAFVSIQKRFPSIFSSARSFGALRLGLRDRREMVRARSSREGLNRASRVLLKSA